MTGLFGPAAPNVQVAYVTFDPDTGAVTGSGVASREDFARMGTMGRRYLLGNGHPSTHYVDLGTGELVPKKASTAVLSGQSLTGLPVPCRLEVALHPEGWSAPLFDPNGVYEVTDGEVDISFAQPGTYRVTVQAVDTVTAEFSITI